VNEFSEQSLISCGGYGIVYKVMNKNCSELYAIKKIPLYRTECEKFYKELNLMKKLKSRYVVEHIDSWNEENYMKIEDFEKSYSSGKSYSHSIFDPKKKNSFTTHSNGVLLSNIE
jgi:serine/threonine protein kinase